MGVAEVLAGMKDQVARHVLFIFPAGRGGAEPVHAVIGQEVGAKLMLEEGRVQDPKPEAVFGLHVMPARWGRSPIERCDRRQQRRLWRSPSPATKGHGGMPWNTIDPVTTSALGDFGLQTVVSRRANLTASPAVVTIGTINGGRAPTSCRRNVVMTGTIRHVRREGSRQARSTDVEADGGEDRREQRAPRPTSMITPMYATTVNDPALAARD
jgi:amidohydrolase